MNSNIVMRKARYGINTSYFFIQTNELVRAFYIDMINLQSIIYEIG